MTEMRYRISKEQTETNRIIIWLQAMTLIVMIIILTVLLTDGIIISRAEPIDLTSRPTITAATGSGNVIKIVDEIDETRTGFITLENQTIKPTPAETEPERVYMGWFKTTGYCNCEKCCGKWAGGPTASGAWPVSSHTIAVDPHVIPLGAHVLINGTEYVAEDTGSGVSGNHIDIYYDDHYTAVCHGLQDAEVWILK